MKLLKRRTFLYSLLAFMTNTLWGRLKMIQKNEKFKMPVIFLGHGSPMNAIADNNYTKALTSLTADIPKPTSILVISAHWETESTQVTAMEKPKTIHDFYGFPKELYNVQYPANGNPELAKDIVKTLGDKVSLDHNWGLDHGTWAVLKFLYPAADIPVIQLSLNKNLSLNDHYELGKELKILRNQGVLIVGSGNIVHNLRAVDWNIDAKAHEWAVSFDKWVKELLLNRNFKPLISEFQNTEIGKLSVPTLDHYLPFLYILGASDQSDKLTFDFEGFQNASMSMRCLRFSA